MLSNVIIKNCKKLFSLSVLFYTTSIYSSDIDEYFIFFRGFHYCQGYTGNKLVKSEHNQEISSPYSFYENPDDTKQQQIKDFLQQSQINQTYISESGKPYPNKYLWIQDLYVNHYAKFIESLTNSSSELIKLMNNNDTKRVTFNKNIFISTSLNIKTAVKYAAGICIQENLRNWPKSIGKDEKGEELNLGYLDVLMIPRQDMSNLGAFPVVEQFALHNIEIPHSCVMRDYTVAEEYNFLLNLPAKYHQSRIPIKIEVDTNKENIKNISGYIRRKCDFLIDKLNKGVAAFQQRQKGKRVFLYLLSHRVDEDQADKLSSELSKNIYNQANAIMIKTNKQLSESSISNYDKLNLPVSVAIEKTLFNFANDSFSLQCSDNITLNMHHIAALTRQNNLNIVRIGKTISGFEVVARSISQGPFKFDEIPEINFVIAAVKDRQEPIIFKFNLVVDRNIRNALYKISETAENKVKFKFSRTKNRAASFADEVDYEVSSSSIYQQFINPGRYALEDFVEQYLEQGEEICEKSIKEFLQAIPKVIRAYTTREENNKIVKHFKDALSYICYENSDDLDVDHEDDLKNVMGMLSDDYETRFISQADSQYEDAAIDLDSAYPIKQVNSDSESESESQEEDRKAYENERQDLSVKIEEALHDLWYEFFPEKVEAEFDNLIDSFIIQGKQQGLDEMTNSDLEDNDNGFSSSNDEEIEDQWSDEETETISVDAFKKEIKEEIKVQLFKPKRKVNHSTVQLINNKKMKH